MKKILMLAILAVSFLPALSRAQATRTWVSGVGDDANPGSRTAPCKTFAGAISKTAPGGIIDVLDPGGFGAVTITKSITIDGDGAEGGVLVSGTDGIIVNAGANGIVVLRNLSFEGLSTGLAGIHVISAGTVHVENCRINGFIGNGINDLNTVTNGQLFIKDTTIHNCTPAGINLAPPVPSTALIERANITDSGNGIVATNISAVITDTTASGNAGVGFLAELQAQLTITRGTAEDNHIGVQTTGGVVLSSSTIVNNAADGIKHTGSGTIRSLADNLIFGNTPDGAPTQTIPLH